MTVVATAALNPLVLRNDFPILAARNSSGHTIAYLDNAATTQRPRQVIQALVDVYEKSYGNVHRGIHWLSEQSTERYEAARETVRKFVNARRAEEIVFTSGTTAAINLVARSWGDAHVRAGDQILLTEMEHHSNLIPWQQLSERTGCQLLFVPIDDQGLLRLDELDRLLCPRTRLVAVTGASNVLGTIPPIPAIVDRVHAAGAVVLVDGAQSVPHRPTDVQALDVDFLAFSGHKLLGPNGIGVLYGRRELLAAMPPFMGGGSMIRRVRWDGFDPADLPMRFEAGTPPIAEAIALATALEYLERVGLERIARHERLLAEHVHNLLHDLGGVRILGPEPHHKSGIVSFTVDGVHAHDVAQICDQAHGVALRAGHHCAMPLHQRLGITASNRASFYLYNTVDEVELLAESLRTVKRIFRR